MTEKDFDSRVRQLFEEHSALVSRRNIIRTDGNGIYDRYLYPIITRDHTPVFRRYDLNYRTNPHLMTRLDS